MEFLKKFFGRRESTEDEERGGTEVIFPERIKALILLIKKGDPIPFSNKERSDFVWRIFSLVNPALYAALPAPAEVITHIYESRHMETDGHIDPNGDGYLDPLDDHNVPNMTSSYIQALRLEERKITIWLREPREADKHFEIPLEETIVKEGKKFPKEATLITIYSSETPKLVSALWPALPKSLGQKN